MKITESTEEVLDVLNEGRATTGYLVERTDRSKSTIHNQLNQLRAGGYVRNVHEPTGLYELVADPREESESDADTEEN